MLPVAVEPHAKVGALVVALQHVGVAVPRHRRRAVLPHVGERAAAGAAREPPKPRALVVVGRALRELKDRHRVEGGGVVVEAALVAALERAVDREVPPPPRRAAVCPVTRERDVRGDGGRRLLGLPKLAEAEHPRRDLLVPRRVPRKLGAVREGHLEPHADPLLDERLHLARLTHPPLAVQVGEEQLEDGADHQPPLRRPRAVPLLLRPRVAAVGPQGHRRLVRAPQVPLPRLPPRQRRGVPAPQAVERPVHRGDVRVVVGPPRLERVRLAPAVHPRARLGPAALTHARELGRRRLRRLRRRRALVGHLVRPVQHREADVVVGRPLQEAVAIGVVALVERLRHVLLELRHLVGRRLAELLHCHRQPRRRARLVGEPRHVHPSLLRRRALRCVVPAEEGAVAMPRVGRPRRKPLRRRAVRPERADELGRRARDEEVHSEAQRRPPARRRQREDDANAAVVGRALRPQAVA